MKEREREQERHTHEYVCRVWVCIYVRAYASSIHCSLLCAFVRACPLRDLDSKKFHLSYSAFGNIWKSIGMILFNQLEICSLKIRQHNNNIKNVDGLIVMGLQTPKFCKLKWHREQKRKQTNLNIK